MEENVICVDNDSSDDLISRIQEYLKNAEYHGDKVTVIRMPKACYDKLFPEQIERAEKEWNVKIKPVKHFTYKEEKEKDVTDIPKPMYHNRVFPVGYDKKKKAKRRARKKAKRSNR